MSLSPDQIDKLTEIINIGFGRAAASLSSLVQQRIILSVPEIRLCSAEELPEYLGLPNPQVTTVHQVFSGWLSGDAILLLDTDSASILINLLSGEAPQPRPLTTSDREALIEIGNILLNAFIGTLGNLLRIKIHFSVPRFHIEFLNEMLSSFQIGEKEIRHTLVIKTFFETRDGNVGGYVVIILGIESLERLCEALD
ncbi:MAG: chemotaxis protein CheC, partial [Anaerolineae bacterium]